MGIRRDSAVVKGEVEVRESAGVAEISEEWLTGRTYITFDELF